MASSKTKEELSMMFRFHEKVILFCSYVPKKNKTVILLSTMHSNMAVSDAKKKPEMILYYNKYKVGVDTMDQMLCSYITHRRTNR